jgi:uncharacterized membrane protein YeaQ/YmgE (transglycosylase-associated protein family)
MNIPTLIFGGLIATLYGAIFHLVRGGSLWRLVTYILLSWAGFWLGHFLAERFDISIINLGSLNLGIATISSFIFMLIGYWIFFGRSSK